MKLVGLLASLLGLLLAADPAQAQCEAAPVSSLPLIEKDGHLLVEARVNGRKAILLLDTGGVTSVIGAGLAARLSLPVRLTSPKINVRDAGGARAARYVTVRGVALGNQRIRPRNYILAALRPGVDGTLAPDLLRDFDLDLDFTAQRLDLYAAGACAGTPPGGGAFSSVAMPAGGWSRRIRIEAALDGRPLWATVDTGARQSYLAASAAREVFGIPMQAAGRARGIFGGEMTVAPQAFGALQVGDIVWEKPSLQLATPEDGFDGAPLLLGLRQMEGLRLFAAYSENRLYLSRTRQP